MPGASWPRPAGIVPWMPWQEVRAGSYALILMDVPMPVMN